MSRLFIDIHKLETTDYGTGGQSTSDPIEENITRLITKTSLTPSDSHKVVIEATRASDSDVENFKGNVA